jgi:mono/diheme cytochrome c family protein
MVESDTSLVRWTGGVNGICGLGLGMRIRFSEVVTAGLAGFFGLMSAMAGEVRFGRDILPVLSDNCLGCHGPDEKNRKGGLRLDTSDGATAVRDGVAAVVPGKPDASELIRRIVSTDPDEVMPTPKSHKPRLKESEVALLRRWIAEGARWGAHWSFERPVRPDVAAGRHPVDALIEGPMSRLGLKVNGPAEKHVVLRRLSFDLRGLPPSRAEAEAFLQDARPLREVVRDTAKAFMASPHYGERMAMWWLDAARYADTDGFQSDSTRNNWPWRDWVVGAFNRNQPFDQFTLEQFAGDLIPGATPEQRLATCFHRNHMTNGEGGRDPEESRVDYVIDRVNTTGTVWLGLTLGCAQCHSHKFDPVSQADYYSLSAFFNSIDEDGKAGGGAKPFLSYKSALTKTAMDEADALVAERRMREASAKEGAQESFRTWLSRTAEGMHPGHRAWAVVADGKLGSAEGTALTVDADGRVTASGANPFQDDYRVEFVPSGRRVTGFRLEIFPVGTERGMALSRGERGEFILTDIKVQVRRSGSSTVRDVLVTGAVADFSADKKANGNYGDVRDTLDDDPRNGWTTKGAAKDVIHTAIFALSEPLVLEAEESLVFELRQRSTLGNANIAQFRLAVTDERGETVRKVGTGPMEEWASLLKSAGVKREPGWAESVLDERVRQRLFGMFLEDYEPYVVAKQALDVAIRQQAEVKAATGNLNVMVLAERKEARRTHILERGVWDKHGAEVGRDVPAAVAPWPEGQPRDRAGLAAWLTSRENPLTARVLMNHLWQMMFGVGLVRTAEDFGLQGERPMHYELLDWLAVELVESGWNLRHVLELMVTSDAYLRDSRMEEAAVRVDPGNRYLARGARFRLPAWMIRDAALASSGLLNRSVGGPPVRPYQPDGVWEEIFMGRFRYEASEGAAQHRRTLYAFWRRSIAPTFLFDSAQRRVCEVRTSRTNTPLQALTLLNDGTMLEAAASMGARVAAEQGSVDEKLAGLFRTVLTRGASSTELDVVRSEYQRALKIYRAKPDEAQRFLSTSLRRPYDKRASADDAAAFAVTASMLLNLDECITHE